MDTWGFIILFPLFFLWLESFCTKNLKRQKQCVLSYRIMLYAGKQKEENVQET